MVLLLWIIVFVCLVFLMRLHPFIDALRSPAGKCADLLALVCDVFLYFCYFPMWYPGSGVVLDCIVS